VEDIGFVWKRCCVGACGGLVVSGTGGLDSVVRLDLLYRCRPLPATANEGSDLKSDTGFE
jgi:hypothetical protein